jgi:carnitine O-acetyltransferase
VRTSTSVDAGEVVAVSTFGNEERLPRLPLPTLEETCERFLAWCAPLLTEDELTATEQAVASFLEPASSAHALQAALGEYDRSDGVDSWLDAFWARRYLGRRDRIALNANYFFLFEDADAGQIERAAGLISAAVNYKLLLDTERIPPVVHHGRALSMEQNRFLFSTTRIPGPVQDTIRAPYSEEWRGPSRAHHIVVFFRDHVFRMDVIGPDGRPHTVEDLAMGLRAVMAHPASATAPRAPIGHLTTKARAAWAESRQALIDLHPRNAHSLDTIETALFCLCLEETRPADAREACRHLLHGDSGNRWFDKALSLIVFGDGTAGLNAEHSNLDGTTTVSFVETLLGQSADDHSRQSGARSQGAPALEAIDFELDVDLEADVRTAATAFAAASAGTATAVLSFEDFGASQAKDLGISPDAFVQMAFQLAHRRAKGFVGATYESVSTRQHHHGRTEAMRVVTPEVMHFVQAMEDADVDETTRKAVFRAAAARHAERSRECQAGRAPEQHLWELQLVQLRCGDALGAAERLALYDSPGWLKMRNDYLSTSSTPSTSVRFGGFGPTSSHCIGIGYLLLRDRFNLHLCTPRQQAKAMLVFAEELRVAVGELKDLLSAA